MADHQLGAESAAILDAVLLFSAGGLFLQTLVVGFIPTMGWASNVPSGIAVVVLLALYTVPRRYSFWVAWSYTLLLMVVLSAYLFFGGGLAMGYASLLAVTAVQGALVLGPRVGVALTVWALGMSVASYVAGSSSVLLVEGQDPEGILLATQLVALTVLGSLVAYAVSRLQDALKASSSDRAQLIEARMESERFVMAMGEPVWVTDGALHVVLANTAAMKLVGVSADVAVGVLLTTWLEMPSLDDRRARGEGVLQTIRGPIPVQVSRSKVVHGSEHRWVVVASDLSRRVEAEERIREAATAADEANQAKSHFLANISHELRTPLNAILGYSEMLLENDRPAQEQRDVERIHASGTHLLGLINDILDMSKIEAGEMEVTEEVQPLDVLVASCVAAVLPLAAAQGNQLNVVPTHLFIQSDARKLSQILLNLLSNAVKFTKNGTITIECRVDDALRLSVTDTGRGISEDDMARLFQPFRQLGEDAVLQPGTGLGLVLSRGLAALLGGTVEAVSVEAEGSTFTLVLPKECIQASAARKALVG